MTTIYNTIFGKHEASLQQIQQLYDTVFLQMKDIKDSFEPIEKDKATLEKNGIKIDLSYMYHPVHTLKSGENIPRLIVLCEQSFDHVVKTMVSLGWCAVRDTHIPNSAFFEKHNTRIFIELDETF